MYLHPFLMFTTRGAIIWMVQAVASLQIAHCSWLGNCLLIQIGNNLMDLCVGTPGDTHTVQVKQPLMAQMND